ncbi:hypothetical protein [Stenotrophomonas sp. GZD-301]|uniref:hypothetical protein n=1 Tax=Stenotrophomonas sp. GZD-301 TaxID=3404814 RepID=UPI003BB6A192
MNQLRAERDALQYAIDVEAARLAAQQTPADRYATALMPLTSQLVEIRHRILLKTPAREAMARCRELERLAAAGAGAVGTAAEQYALASELRDLQLHFSSARRRPLTWKAVLALGAVVAAMVFLPGLIVDWLTR